MTGTRSTTEAPNNNHAAGHYKQFTKLDLPDAAMNAELKKRLEQFEKELLGIFADYGAFPTAAQEGLMDMIYNLGAPKFKADFPSFVAAAKSKDWKKAAAECHRKGVPEERNDFVKNLFLKAG